MQRQLGSYEGPATITLEGESAVEVECYFTVTQDMIFAGRDLLPGLKGWRGSFRTDALTMLSGSGTLILPDGRSGDIIVTQIRIPEGRGTFTGSGDPPIDV